MADIKTLTDWTLAQLKRSGGLVYDGMVPASVPSQTNGEIKPYVAVWTQPLREHDEQPLSYTSSETAGDLRITVAGPTPGTVRSWSQGVIRALNRVTAPGGGEYRHVPPHVPISFDETVAPGRYYQPLTFSFQQP